MMNNSPRHVISGLVALAALIALTSCSATRLTDVWRDPGYAGGSFRQVAVFVLGADEAVRKLVEDEIVRRLPMSTRGVGGYGIVPEAERGDIDKARDRIRAGGFDGVEVVGVKVQLFPRVAVVAQVRAKPGGDSDARTTHVDSPIRGNATLEV